MDNTQNRDQIQKKKISTKKATSQKNAGRGQKNVLSRNQGGLQMQNTAQEYMNDQLHGINAHINQMSTQQFGKVTKGITPSQTNINKIIQKNQGFKEGTFQSPNVKLFMGQTQSQSHHNLQQMNIQSQQKHGPGVSNHQLQQPNYHDISQSDPALVNPQNFNSMKQLTQKQNAIYQQMKTGHNINSRIPLNNVISHQQKFIGQAGKGVNTASALNIPQASNLTYTQNVNTQVSKNKIIQQNQIPMSGAKNVNLRVNSQNSRKEDSKPKINDNCYTDEDLANFLKQGTQASHNNSASMQRSASSRASRRVKASTTKGGVNNIISATMQNEETKENSLNDPKNKTLYTNISLREISQSPDRVQSQTSKGKIVLAGKQSGISLAKKDGQGNLYIKNQDKNRTRAASKLESHHEQNQINFENQIQLKNYLSQINQAQIGGNNEQQTDKNGSVLNIKTVQDINIYNNSFIVNSATGVPANFQNVQQQPQSNITQNRNIVQHSQGQMMIQNVNTAQVKTVTSKNNNNKGLKLRKELSGLTSNLSQARSVSQGRQNNRGTSNSSGVNIQGGLSRNTNGVMTEYNSHGALQTNSSQFSKAYDAYNTNIRTQNIQHLQQNPNQKRVINPPNKKYGNLAALSGIQKKQSSSNHNTYQGYYQNQGSTGKATQLNKVLKGNNSSNTSRVGSRQDSRQEARNINSKTSDQRFIQQNLTKIAISEINLKNQSQNSQLTLQQMKNHYIKNQKMLVSNQNLINTEVNRPVSQIESINPNGLFNELEILKAKGNATEFLNNQHSHSQINNSSQFHNKHYAANVAGQKNNLNSYEMRNHSLQDIKMRGMDPQTAHKFKNQAQNLSSDQEKDKTYLGSEGSIINSVQFNSKGKRNQTQETSKTQIYPPDNSNEQTHKSKIKNEFVDQMKLLQQNLTQIQKQCQEIKIGNKEDQIKNQMKNIEAFLVKITTYQHKVLTQSKNMKLDQELKTCSQVYQQTRVLKALCHLDVGQNYESIQEIKKIGEVQSLINSDKSMNSLTSDQLLANNFLQDQQAEISKSETIRYALLIMCLSQYRMGEHQESLSTITLCVNIFKDFKDAYLVRGQKFLLQKKYQNAMQDFTKFDEMVEIELKEIVSTQPNRQNFFIFQVCVAKESIGDAYKKMKRYKQAAKNYQDAINELQSLMKQQNKQQDFYRKMGTKLQHFQSKIKLKIAMCCYYQGQIKKAMHIFEDQISYYKKFDPTDIKVQQKSIKSHFYHAKSLMALKERDTTDSVGYLQALKGLTFCINDEIDPELHEIYSGNAHFEIFKMFIKQKDIFNAHEYLQKATDNNFNSKRLSLYRDFTEGVVYLMKRKIKKGVQILTDLLEVVINGQKEIEKRDQNIEIEKESSQDPTKGRYNIQESYQNLNTDKDLPAESLTDDKTTINSKANHLASGRFTKEMYEFLIFNIYIYRSYGYVAIEKYEHALEDLKKAKKINYKLIDRATIYNKWLSRGILKMDTEEYLMASKYFGKASIRYPNNKDSFCLNVISIVRSYSYSMMNMYVDNNQKLEKVEQTKKFLNIAIECCCKVEKQPSLYFFRGLLNYQLHHFYDALNDFNVAIAEEEEPTGQFHLARGRCYACLSILDEAMKDLSIALELDDSLHEAYIYRGKCAYLLGDNNLAFHDFQKLIISDQKNPMVHIYAGNLLMTTGAYTDAIKAFDNADTVQETPFASFQRIRCYCALSNLENAFEQMQLTMHQSPNEKYMVYDFKVLLQLLSAVRSFAFSKGDNNEPDENGIKEQMEILKNCIAQITSVIEVFEKKEPINLKKEHSPMTIQIIPNVKRIKIEKQFVINKLQPHREGIPQFTPLSSSERKQLEGIEMYGYYRENIFQMEEMYLYRAVFHIYHHDYQAALKDLHMSWKLHFIQKKTDHDSRKVGIETDKDHMFGKFSMSQLVSPIESLKSYNNSQNTDLSEVGLCSLNVGEYQLNQLIIQIQTQNYTEAHKIVNELLAMNPSSNEFSKGIKQLLLVRALIYQELGQTEKHNHDMTLYLKNFNQIVKNKQNVVLIEPFETKGRICNQFDPILMNFQKNKGKGSFEIQMRPSFSMPFIKPPNMIPNINEEILQSEFNLKQIDAPMPEAPWNRNCVLKNNFQPQNFVYEISPRWTQKQPNQSIQLPSMEKNQQFINQFFNRDSLLIYDEKMMEEIDDLSDCDKVSLISDIELGDEVGEISGAQNMQSNNAKVPANEEIIEGKDNNLNMNLLKVQKLNFGKDKMSNQQTKKPGNTVSNGIMLSKSKYRCSNIKICESCHLTDADVHQLDITNQDQLISFLGLSTNERSKKIDSVKLNKVGKDEDTISEDEYDSQSDGGESKNSKKNGEKDSKYSHSRFSSQIPDDLDEMAVMAAEGQDINATEIHIDNKKLTNDNRKLLQKKEMPNLSTNKQFRDDIDSIQNRADGKEIRINTPTDDMSSPVPKQKKKDNHKPAPQRNNQKDNEQVLDDSMVLVGSKNLSKGMKKKQPGKKMGIGNLNIHNLKKNKLAIAFNNLENDKTSDKEEDSDK